MSYPVYFRPFTSYANFSLAVPALGRHAFSKLGVGAPSFFLCSSSAGRHVFSNFRAGAPSFPARPTSQRHYCRKLGAGAPSFFPGGSCRRALSRHETRGRRSEFLPCRSSPRAPAVGCCRVSKLGAGAPSFCSDIPASSLPKTRSRRSEILLRHPSVITAENWEPALRVALPHFD